MKNKSWLGSIIFEYFKKHMVINLAKTSDSYFLSQVWCFLLMLFITFTLVTNLLSGRNLAVEFSVGFSNSHKWVFLTRKFSQRLILRVHITTPNTLLDGTFPQNNRRDDEFQRIFEVSFVFLNCSFILIAPPFNTQSRILLVSFWCLRWRECSVVVSAFWRLR